jgi:hypothetical protein
MKSLKKSEDGRMTAAGASSYMVVLSGQSQETNPMGRMDAQTRKPKGNDGKARTKVAPGTDGRVIQPARVFHHAPESKGGLP